MKEQRRLIILTTATNLGRGAEGSAAGAGEVAWKVAGADGPRAGNHGGEAVPHSGGVF